MYKKVFQSVNISDICTFFWTKKPLFPGFKCVDSVVHWRRCRATHNGGGAAAAMRPFADEKINVEHTAFNEVMSSVRICVEWEFGDIVTQWAHVNYKRNQVIANGSRPGQQYIVAALLSNCRNCLRPAQTSQYFECLPPTLEEYIASLSWTLLPKTIRV